MRDLGFVLSGLFVGLVALAFAGSIASEHVATPLDQQVAWAAGAGACFYLFSGSLARNSGRRWRSPGFRDTPTGEDAEHRRLDRWIAMGIYGLMTAMATVVAIALVVNSSTTTESRVLGFAVLTMQFAWAVYLRRLPVTAFGGADASASIPVR